MTEFRTLRLRLDGAYDHWKKLVRLKNSALHPDGIRLRGRDHRSYLRSAIAYKFWIIRSRREPFAYLHH